MNTYTLNSSQKVRAGKITIITVTTEDVSELNVTGPVSLGDIAIEDASAGMGSTLTAIDFKNQVVA